MKNWGADNDANCVSTGIIAIIIIIVVTEISVGIDICQNQPNQTVQYTCQAAIVSFVNVNLGTLNDSMPMGG